MEDLSETITLAISEFISDIIIQLPIYLSAAVLIFIGFAVAWLLGMLTHKFIYRIDSKANQRSSGTGNAHPKLREIYAFVISKAIFWSVLIYFLDSAADLLGWRLFINIFDSLVHIVPSILAGLAIILAGLLISNYSKFVIERSFNRLISTIIQWGIIVITILLGIQQVGINVELISLLVTITTAAMLGSATLALGFGAKSLTANIIGAQYIKKQLSIGENIKIDNIEGKIIEITQTNVVIESKNGINIIPGKYFQDQCSTIASKVTVSKNAR